MATMTRFIQTCTRFIRTSISRGRHLSSSQVRGGRVLLLAVTVLAILALFSSDAVRAQFQPHDQTLLDAWKLAERAGTYRFTSQLTQTTIPAPRLANVGQTVKTEHMTVQGAIDRRADTLELALWDNQAAAFDPARALEIRIEQGQAQGRVPGGEWTALDDFTDTFAPGGDVAAYLLAARHVSYLGAERRVLTPFDATLVSHRYHFAVDGDALAQIIAVQLEDELRRKGELPPGVYLSLSEQFRQVVGVGEAWISEGGLPQRMTVEIEFPQQQNGERRLISVQTDFSDFDSTLVAAAVGTFRNRLLLLQYDLAQVWDPQQIAATLLFMLLLAATALLLNRVPRRRREAVVSLALLLVMVSVEVSRAAPLPAVLAGVAPPLPQSAPAQKPLPTPAPGFDSRQAPLSQAMAQPHALLGRSTLNSEFDGPDADRDGLPDSKEASWGTDPNNPDSDGDGLMDGEEVRRCPDRQAGLVNNLLSGENAAAPACANPKVADTDGDGLTDKQEAVYLGTNVNDKDSDGDGLADNVEVQGFLHASVMRYTNPLNPDTDGDGILDGIECPEGSCIDSDGVGDPDVFAIDNDGDGFIGAFDMSPNTALGKGAPFNAANPFQLQLANLNTDKSVFVEFQIRPTNPNHIGFGQSVLDWPTGDSAGQIQRRLTTTFADVNPLPANVAAPSPYPQSHGDMRLIPMLDIEMDGGAAPLPRVPAAQAVKFRSTPLLAAMQIIREVESITVFGFAVEPEALKIRVNLLNVDYANYTLEIHKASCEGNLSAPVFPAAALSEDSEVTYNSGALSVIGDGGHVAVLKAPGLAANCIPIPEVKPDVTQAPLNFLAPLTEFGELKLTQSGVRAIELQLTGFAKPTQHTVELYQGTCRARGALRGSPLLLTPGTPQTLNGLNLVELADGAHIALLKQGTTTLACAALGNVVNGPVSAVEMIDAAAMAKMGIVVSEKDNAGTLVAHIPLNIAHDAKTGVSSGFAGTMLYETAAATDWQHTARMSWWVQVLTDNCGAPPAEILEGVETQFRLAAFCGANANQLQLVHVYDEDWLLAGLAVREEHDYDMTIIFEDPATDTNKESDDLLWHLAKGLDEQFVTGVDCVRINPGDPCATDGQRDITLATIYSRFANTANGASSAIDRWGIDASVFHVEKLDTQLASYIDMGKVMQTYAPDLLRTHFLANGAPVTKAPVLLFASENSHRAITLGTAGYSSSQANRATVDFAPAGQDAQSVLTIASLNWAPYRYDAASQSWTSYPFEEYWDLLALRLKASADFGAGPDEASRTVADGKIRLAQTYFAYLLNGRAGLVQSDNLALGQFDLNAANYASYQERLQWVIDAGTLSVYVAEGKLINQVILPIVQHININARQYHLYQLRMSREGVARINDLDDALEMVVPPGGISDDVPWKAIFNGAGDDMVSSWFRNFRPGNLSKVGGRITSYGAAGFAGAAIATGIAGSIYAGAQGNGVGAATGVLNGLALAAEVANSVGLLATANQALANAGAGAKTFTTIKNALGTTSRAAKIAGIVGLAIGEAFNYGLLIGQIAANGLAAGSLQANRIAATSVAASVVSGMLFVLASTGIGAIAVAILGLIDGMITLICGFLSDDELASVPGILFCKGITGWLIELTAFFLYAQNEITRINDPYRLNYTSFGPGLAQPASGFRTDADLSLEIGLRNTLALASLPINLGILYGWQFNETTLQSARFQYDIVTAIPDKDAKKLHDDVVRDEGANPWTVLERDADGDVVSVYDDTTLTKSDGLNLPPAPGINQKIPAYLAEGYQVPVQECISNATLLFPLPPIVVCWVRSRGETNYNDLNLQFDVFPATLDDFYALELTGAEPGRYRQRWANNSALPFPPLIDADGDGLRFDADADDSRWDTDGDGISDAVEKARNSKPDQIDSDGDGLSDIHEAIWGADPTLPDSDGDGLSDGEEVHGWSIGYGVAANGAPLTSWTRSDPLNRDIDRDSILDSQEKIFGFNPNLTNDPTVLVYKGQVVEERAPLLLTRFDEAGNAATFLDTAAPSGRNTAGCQGNACPRSGVRGRFGNAAHFDGVDDFASTPADPRIGAMRTNFTLSAWVKPLKLTGTQAVIQIGPGGPNGAGGFTFGLSDANLFVRFEGGGGTFVQTLPVGSIPLNQWTQIGVEVWSSNGSLYMYVNGVERGVQTSILKPVSANPIVTIGAARQPATNTPPADGSPVPNVVVDPFAGSIDEVLIQNWVPVDTSSIEAIFAGRYNADDGFLRPGQEVTYASHVENSLMARNLAGKRTLTWPAALTDAPSTQTPLVLEPTGRQSYTDPFAVKSTAASGVYTLSQAVDAIVNIPAVDVWKDPAGNQLFAWKGPQLFAGISSSDSGSQPVNLNNRSFTIAGWVRPINGDTNRRGILGRNSGQNDAFPYLLTEGRQLKFGFGAGSGLAAVEVVANKDGDTNVLNLNQWNFIAVRYDLNGALAAARSVTFFVNGVKLNSAATNAVPNSTFTNFFLGRASNLGKVEVSQFKLTCEGDGIGDGEYDIIGSSSASSENLARLVGTEGAEGTIFPLSVTRSFSDTYVINICEDDNDTRTVCESNDEDMGSIVLTTNQSSIPAGAASFANPSDATSCAYIWAMAGFPDLGTLAYKFTNDSLPFMGDLRQFEIHSAALTDAEIANIRSHAEQVAQFRLDEITGATSFEDYIAYHQLTCSSAQCPQAGLEGAQNVSVRFDGVDDVLGESPTINLNDRISTDIAGNNTGYALSLWLKPEKPTGAVHNSVVSIASFTRANGSKGELNLVHKTTPKEGFTIFYRDEETGNPFSEIGNCQAFDEVWEYGEWIHASISMDKARQTANLYTYGFRCSTPSIPLTATYIPVAGDLFTLGRNPAKSAYLRYQGQMDDLYIHRRPLTQAEVTAIYRGGVYRHWDLNEPAAAPTVPVKGLMRQALRFASFADRYALIGDRADIYRLDGEMGDAAPNPITFALWVRAEELANRKRPLLSIPRRSDQSPQNNDLLIYLDNGTPKIHYYQTDTQSNRTGAADRKIAEGVWQHLVFRKDAAGVMSIFINGYKASNIAGNWEPSRVRSPSGALFLGADTLDSSFFQGLIDEVMVFRAALTDQEIRELYNYQNSWVDERIENAVTVDAGAPTSSLAVKSTYFADKPHLLYIATADAETRVDNAELGVDNGDGLRWTGAARDDTDATGNTWLGHFEPTGDGRYELFSRATDRVGNQEPVNKVVTVLVDGRAPVLTFNAVGGLIRPEQSATEEAVWSVYLEGASHDPPITGTEESGSGIVTIDVRLFDQNGETATLFDTQRATLDAATGFWSVRYKLNAANPTGVYTATAIATDGVGNETVAIPISIRLDTTAPTAQITFLSSPNPQGRAAADSFPAILGKDGMISGIVSEQPSDVVSQTVVAGVAMVEVAFAPLFGHGSTFRNQPLAPATRLYLPLDESLRRDEPDRAFADVSPAAQAPLTCAGEACPQAGAAGKMAQALAFDGVNDSLTLSNTASINGLVNDFTVGAWIKPSATLGQGRIVSTARTASVNGWGIGAYGQRILFTSYGIQDYLGNIDVLLPNVWQHVAVHLTADNDAEFYLNGQLVETIPGDAPAVADGDDRLLIGATTEPGELATSQHFAGVIDEVMVMTGRPSPADWLTLLGADPTLHLTFDERFIHPNTRMSNDAGLAVGDLAYLANNLPADHNLRATGIVGAGSLRVNEAEGALLGGAAPGVFAHGNGPFSLAFWASLDNADSSMSMWIGRFEGLSRLLMSAQSVEAIFTEQPNLTVPTANLVGAWQHVLLTYDGSTRVLYLNGAEIGRDTIAPNALNTIPAGMIVAGGTGYLDDLRVYRYALNAREAHALAETGWLPTATQMARTTNVEASWSAFVPPGLEGFYELKSRGTDLLGNVGEAPNEIVTWRGIVDSLAPRLLSFTATPAGGGVTFALAAEDFDLALGNMTMPAACSVANTTVTPQFYASPWYRAFAAQTATSQDAAQVANRAFRATIQCQAEYARTHDAFTICDLANNCTTATYTGPNVGAPSATATPTATATGTPTAPATPTATATPTVSATPTATATATRTPVATATPTRTNTPIPTSTATTTATRTPVPTATATSLPTATPLPTATASATPAPTATATATPLPTATATHTPVPTPTATATFLPTATATATASSTPTQQPSPTPTPTATSTTAPSGGATVTGVLYNDINKNSSQDGGEAGIPDLTVTLTDSQTTARLTRTAVTDANGVYTFTDVPMGEYSLSVDLPPGQVVVDLPNLTVAVTGAEPVIVPPAPVQTQWALYLPNVQR